MIRFDRLFALGVLSLAGSLSLSGPAAAQDFAACAKITDNQQRLACFDQASRTLPATPAPTAAPQAQPFAVPAAPPPSPSGTTFNPFASAAPAAPNPADFGRSSLPVSEPPPRPDELTSITAKAIQIIDPEGKPTFILDNNQTWASVKYVHIVPRNKGPNIVKIESSAVGYLMTLNDASFQFGVRRLK